MTYNIKILRTLILWILALWSLIILIFIGLEVLHHYSHARDLALTEAQPSIKKDLAYRKWIASHGGVYVPVTKRTPPSVYLSHIPKRDITSNYGDDLTLMNPAYSLRQMMDDYSKLYGTKAKITSTKYLNLHNVPDEWEKKALAAVKKSKKDFHEISMIEDKEYLRLLNPLFVQESCLKCHGHQGYSIGELRGGVSVAIELKHYYAMIKKGILLAIFNNLLIWMIGVLAILWGYKRAKKYINDKINTYEQNIYSLIDLIEKRDRYTAGHGQRVASYSKLIAEKMGLDSHTIELLYRAAMLHDIGKIAIPDSILLKPGQLNDLEYSLIQEHVKASYELLNGVDIFKDLAVLVKHHHEHYDGSGYPSQLQGEEIPLASHIMSFCDAFDAMTTDRIYKGRKSITQALAEAQELKGKQFHPKVVDVACRVLKDIELTNISQIPQNRNEEERFSYFFKDPLTGCYNYSYLKFLALRSDFKTYQLLYIISLQNFSQYNKKYGWESGDDLLKEITDRLISQNPNVLVIRVYGDDFVVISKEDTILNLQGIKGEILKESDITCKHKKIDIERFDINNLEKIIDAM